MGPIVRKDWLDELGLDVPETIDDWEIMLKAFRDKKGASVGLAGGGIGRWLVNAKSTNEKYDLIGTKYPVAKRGDVPKFGQVDNTMMNIMEAISANSKNPGLAARYLDYFFSEEGMVLLNFGKEGEVYDVVDGKRVFKKELIEQSKLQSYAEYTGGLGVQLWDAYSQSLAFPNQKDAMTRC